MVKCSAILLTAGKSTRMGSLKALLPWEGTTLLQYQLSQFHLSSVDQVIVVVGYQSSKILPYLENSSAHVVWNEHVERGKTESIKKGLLSLDENTDCFMIAAVDQPVNQSLIDAMIHQYVQTKSNIIVPVYKGKRGHPILFSSELLEEIMQINEETNGLKALLYTRKNEINELIVEDPSVLFNFNSREDYEEALCKGGKSK